MCSGMMGGSGLGVCAATSHHPSINQHIPTLVQEPVVSFPGKPPSHSGALDLAQLQRSVYPPTRCCFSLPAAAKLRQQNVAHLRFKLWHSSLRHTPGTRAYKNTLARCSNTVLSAGSTGRTLVSSIRCQSSPAPGPAPLWPRAHTLKWPMNPVRPPEFTCSSTTSPTHKGSGKARKTPTPALRQCVVFYMDARCTPRPCICLTQQSLAGSVAPGCAHVAGHRRTHITATQSSGSPQPCTRWCPFHPSAVSHSVTQRHAPLQPASCTRGPGLHHGLHHHQPLATRRVGPSLSPGRLGERRWSPVSYALSEVVRREGGGSEGTRAQAAIRCVVGSATVPNREEDRYTATPAHYHAPPCTHSHTHGALPQSEARYAPKHPRCGTGGEWFQACS